MDSERIEGISHQVKGAIKQTLGRIIGDPVLRQSGIDEYEAGKVQKAVGGARDAAETEL